MEEKKVSIIVPVYGVELYLEECLESLVHQTYRNLEIILVDDASPDSCPEICDRYAVMDKRIKVIHKKNGGAGSARNVGMSNFSGEYVCFVDSDDYTALNYVERLAEGLESQDVDIVVSRYKCLYKNGSVQGSVTLEPGIYTQVEYLRQFLCDWNCGLLWNKIFKKEVVKGLKFEEGRRIDDEFFTYQAVMQAKRVAQIENELYIYRMRASGVMMSGSNCYEKMLKDQIDYLSERYRLVSTKYSELKAEYLENLMDNLISLKRKARTYPDVKRRVQQEIRSLLLTALAGPVSLKKKYIFIWNIWGAGEERVDIEELSNGERENFFK